MRQLGTCASRDAGNRTGMTGATDEPIPAADEADVAEQAQELDGAGSVTPPEVSATEANEADALEQGTAISEADEDLYPHQADRAEE